MARSYEAQYNQPVADAIKGDTSGWYCDTLLSLVKPLSEALAEFCNKAMKGIGTDEGALIRILSFHSKREYGPCQWPWVYSQMGLSKSYIIMCFDSW